MTSCASHRATAPPRHRATAPPRHKQRNPLIYVLSGPCALAVAVLLAFLSQARCNTNWWAFSYTVSGTNLLLRFDVVPDTTNYYTFDEATNLPQIKTRLTTLGGGSNAWNFGVLNPGGGADASLVALGGGTNAWNFSTDARTSPKFWRVRKLPAAPDGGYMQFAYTLAGQNLNVRFSLTPDLTNYYILDVSTNLVQFTPITMYYGGGSNAWAVSAFTSQSQPTFWRVRRIPVATALDTDGDGLDDAFELSHGLNPLDPSDANANSGLVDANNNPLTWLQAYHYYFVYNTKIYDAVSREVSSFNFGQPTANYEGISREFSIFTTPGPDANQNGIDDFYELNHGFTNASQFSGFTSDFPNNTGTPLTWLQLYQLNFGANRTLYDTVSREVSEFNFGQPTANYEGLSREFSVFNTPQPDANGDGIDDAYALNHGITNANALSGYTSDFPNNAGTPLTWLQLYRLTFGQNRTLYDTVSREVSVFNFGQPAANYEAISREVSVFNYGQPTAHYEAISREVSVFNQP